MKRLLKISARYSADVEAVVEYYADQAPRVVWRFLDAVDEARRQIERNPGLAGTQHAAELNWPELRSLALKGFPYRLYFLNHPERLLALRLVHQRRDALEVLRDVDLEARHDEDPVPPDDADDE